MKYIINIIILLLLDTALFGLTSKYSFPKLEYCHINNSEPALHKFYTKLADLDQGKDTQVRILHIGDSHIQADFFTSVIRNQLQSRFGNAGRGFIYPYRLAGTNSPLDFQIKSANVWQSDKILKNPGMSFGISGYRVLSYDKQIALDILSKNSENKFSQIEFWHNLDDFNIIQNDNFKSVQTLYGRRTTIKLKEEVSNFNLQIVQKDTLSQNLELGGIVLRNDKPGVLYSSIGINGASYRTFNNIENLKSDLNKLSPDLVIISLGTNDSYSKVFNLADFQRSFDYLIRTISLNNPGAGIIITLPADNYLRKRRGYKNNPNVEILNEFIKEYCLLNDLAYWDLYNVMGGSGSMKQWVKSGLAGKDRVHFTQSGYKIQGELFSKSLLDDFQAFEDKRTSIKKILK